MQKNIFLIAALGISILGAAQNSSSPTNKYILKNNSMRAHAALNEGGFPFGYAGNTKKTVYPAVTNTQSISLAILGSAGNAFGIAFGGRTFLWADPSINSI